MVRILRLAAIISVTIYIIIMLVSFLIYKKVDVDIIKKWGFGFSLLLFLGSFPLYKSTYHGGKVANSTYSAYIPADEHLHHKLHKDYEQTTRGKGSILQKSFIMSAAFILLVTIFLAKFF